MKELHPFVILVLAIAIGSAIAPFVLPAIGWALAAAIVAAVIFGTWRLTWWLVPRVFRVAMSLLGDASRAIGSGIRSASDSNREMLSQVVKPKDHEAWLNGISYLLTLVLLAAIAFASVAYGSPVRSPSVRAEFQRQHPCPSTGQPRGACPGHQVDHIQALKCGGRDELGNLQWLAVEAHKEKTRRDMRGCRSRTAD